MKKILKIIPLEEKKNLVYFFFLIIIVMLLESLSIGAVFPLIITILSDNFKQEKIYSLFETYFGVFNYEQMVFILLILILLIFIIKNLFLIFLQWWKHGFTNRVQLKIQKKLFKIYLNQSYLDSSKQNTAIKMRNITQESSRFAKYFMDVLTICIESMVILSIGTVLLYLNSKVAITIFLLISILTLIFYLIAKTKVFRWGKQRLVHNGISMKALLEGLSSIKELKIFRKQNFFLNKFSTEEGKYLHLTRLFSIFNDSPRILIESLMVFALCVSIIFMTYSGIEKKEILATLGMFAVAGFRLFPSTTRMINSINQIKSNSASMDLIINEYDLENNFEELNETHNENVINKFSKNIELTNVSFNYLTKEKSIIDNFNFKINKGTKIAIFGDSGSGKSTLLNLIIGFLKPSNGTIKLDGEQIFNNNNIKSLFSYVSQETFLLDETISFNITFKSKLDQSDLVKLREVIDIVNLSEFISNLENGLDTVIGEKGTDISGGQRQRISIARAIFADKEILILDEPTNELDEKNEKEIVRKIFKNYSDKTVIITSHNRDLLKYCDQIIYFKEKQLILENNNEKII
tara:strand:- start:13261 stop:14994 length:1734 start_codon:yes stop_codon:yes gene_type:complete